MQARLALNNAPGSRKYFSSSLSYFELGIFADRVWYDDLQLNELSANLTVDSGLDRARVSIPGGSVYSQGSS